MAVSIRGHEAVRSAWQCPHTGGYLGSFESVERRVAIGETCGDQRRCDETAEAYVGRKTASGANMIFADA